MNESETRRNERGGGDGDGVGNGRQEVIKIVLMIMKIQRCAVVSGT